MVIEEIIGILGTILIIFGDFTIYKNKKFRKNYTYPALILGGVFLTIYSIYINDLIFIVLQVIYIFTTSYGYMKIREKRK